MEVNDRHSTRDLGEAAYLHCLGFKLIELDRRDPRSAYFVFEGDKEFMEMKAVDYYEYRTKVDAQKYSESLRALKKMLMAIRNASNV